MARIPVRFNRIAAAFDEAARAPPVRLCESSGSDHSPEDLTDLSDLVNSFIESYCGDETAERKIGQGEENESYWSDSETNETLKSLVGNNMSGGNEDDDVKRKILEQTELVCRSVRDMSSEGFKRQLMSRLRDKGFDAGLCKSRWEKFGQHPAGSYEYVDVNVNGIRYIIEVNLAGEFEIARPTTSYVSLIDAFPQIFVGKPEELEQIVRLMCRAMRASMRSREMKMPPWRRNGYMQAKWFAQYKRTTNEISAKNASEKNGVAATKKSVGFETLPTISYYCRENFASKAGLRVGYLTAALNANGSIALQL